MNIAHDCHTLDLSEIEKELKGVRMVAMKFNQTILGENLGLELRLEGKSVAAHREIQDHYFYSSGAPLKLDGYSSYRVKIKRNVYARGRSVFIEGHPGKSCRDYPNPDFDSYMACDDQYMRDKIKKLSPPGELLSTVNKLSGLNVTPLWLTGDMSKVTTNPVLVSTHLQSMASIQAVFCKTFFCQKTFSIETEMPL